jgi:hypothetical protein
MSNSDSLPTWLRGLLGRKSPEEGWSRAPEGVRRRLWWRSHVNDGYKVVGVPRWCTRWSGGCGEASGATNWGLEVNSLGYRGSRPSSALMAWRRENSKIGARWGRARSEVGLISKAT